jgi:hypothetical protein
MYLWVHFDLRTNSTIILLTETSLISDVFSGRKEPISNILLTLASTYRDLTFCSMNEREKEEKVGRGR